MNISRKNKFEIQLLSENYLNSKRIIDEAEKCIIKCPSYRLHSHRRIVSHIEYVADTLRDKERFIIINEVIMGKSGKWYLEFFSAPTYYRIRNRAYTQFLNCL